MAKENANIEGYKYPMSIRHIEIPSTYQEFALAILMLSFLAMLIS